MLLKLKDTIALFKWCSGQRVNWENSALCGVNVEEDELKLMAENMGCTTENMPFLYIGLPLGGYLRQATFWQPIVDKVQRKLDKWRRLNLLRGGRATLCQSILANLPTLCMSLFAIPDNVASSLEILVRFFFGKGIQEAISTT